MAGGAALIALVQLVYLGYLTFAAEPPPAIKTGKVINPVETSVSDLGSTMWKLYTGFALLVALANAGLNWLAMHRYRTAEQYRLLVAVAIFNLALGAIMLNHWLPAVLGCLLGIPTALYAAGILIGDDAKKVFRLVETGRTLEEALTGGGKVPGLSGKQSAVADAGDLLIGDAKPTPAGSGVRAVAPGGSGRRPAPAASGKRPAPVASGSRPAAQKNPPKR